MKTLSLKLSGSLFAKLAFAANKRGESRSALIREAIGIIIRNMRKLLGRRGFGLDGSRV